jgi:hypothetical protein
MSTLKANAVQFGDSATASQNFHWQTNLNGTMSLFRGNVGAPIGVAILTVPVSGGRITLENRPAEILLDTSNGYGSTNTFIRRWANLQINLGGTAITAADSATLGGSLVINESDIYTVTYTDNFNAAHTTGLTLNSATNTAIASVSAANRLGIATSGAADQGATIISRRWFPAGSVIRANTQGGAAAGAAPSLAFIHIIRG